MNPYFALWKIRRELSILARRLSYLCFLRPIERLINRLYDLLSRRLISATWNTGASEAQSIAIYLVFQPGGISDVSFLTVDCLRRAGFDVLVVSNAKLTEGDTRRLSCYALGILERPNYGLDFGGYRDAVLWIRSEGLLPKEILLLNDSVSCLVGDFQRFMWIVRKQMGSVVGAVAMNEGRGRGEILLSYFLLIKSSAIRRVEFWNFWQRYQMANSRYVTVRRGERGFSHMLREVGISVNAFIRPDVLRAENLKTVAYSDLIFGLYYAAFTELPFILRRNQLVAMAGSVSPDVIRTNVIAFIQQVASRRPYVASFPFLCHCTFKLPIQKRGTTLLQKLAVCRLCDAIDDGLFSVDQSAVREDIYKLRKEHQKLRLVAEFGDQLQEGLPPIQDLADIVKCV